MMTSSNGNIFHVTGLLWGESTGHRWIPLTKLQWRGALVFSLISALTHGWANHRGTGDSRRHRAHYDVTVMWVPSYFWEIKMSNTRIFNVLPYFLPAVHRYQKPVARKYQYTDINYAYFDNDDWLRPAEASVNRVLVQLMTCRLFGTKPLTQPMYTDHPFGARLLF